MNLKKVKYLVYGLAAGLVLMAVLTLITKSVAFLWAMLALALAITWAEMTFFRCPYCGKLLRNWDAKFCPHCGKKLDHSE